MSVIIVKNGKQMTKKQSKFWIGNNMVTYLISQMLRAGYDVPEIARVAQLPEEDIKTRINQVIEKNLKDKTGNAMGH